MNDDPTVKKIVFNQENDEVVPEEAEAEQAVVEAAENGEIVDDSNYELVAGELAALIEAAGDDSDKAKEDLAAYIHDVLSDQEMLHPVERTIIFELLSKTQRDKLCNEIASSSDTLIDTFTIENNNLGNSKLGLCDHIEESLVGVPNKVSGLIPDHKEDIGKPLEKSYNQTTMRAYERFYDRASERKTFITKLETANNSESLNEIATNYQMHFDEHAKRNAELKEVTKVARGENQGEDQNLFEAFDPDVREETVNLLVEAVAKAKEDDQPATARVAEMLSAKGFNIDEILSDCAKFQEQYRTNRFDTRKEVSEPITKSLEDIDKFMTEARYATQNGNNPENAKTIYDSQSALLDDIVKNMKSIKEKVEEDQTTARNELHTRAANIPRAPKIRAKVKSANAIQFNE